MCVFGRGGGGIGEGVIGDTIIGVDGGCLLSSAGDAGSLLAVQ